MKESKYYIAAGYEQMDIHTMEQFPSKQFYQRLRGGFLKVSWRKLVCNNLGLPKWIFMLRLVAHGKLYTRDKLSKWGVICNVMCPLCDKESESHSCLFFLCEMSAQIWQRLLQWQGITRRPKDWDAEIRWLTNYAKGKIAKAELYRIVLAAAAYTIWKERNMRVFQDKKQQLDVMIKLVMQEMFFRGNLRTKVARWLTNFNFYPV
ncbi:uncharacterized protein LOC132614137 [Lycium barbarum]|uniref:uncharacterized protein LOC132614137 n=1 Tax=Lycium barbarum TaxID=112863 RepID=UPI00293EDC30|nr:uncharacterized protein LOC132614137 [Lycium barbarum]